MWRPDNWDKYKRAEAKRWFDETGSGSFSFPHFELGADAMLGSVLQLLENELLCPRRVADDIKLFIGAIPEKK